MINIRNILVTLCSLSFFMIGADKFLSFMKPQCSLMGNVSTTVWYLLGVMQFAAGILIWTPKYRRFVAGFFVVFMLVFTFIHISNNTSDYGGALFMAGLLALLAWDPRFIRGKNA